MDEPDPLVERLLASLAPETRALCPSRETLVAYRDTPHVRVCPTCQDDLADWEALECGEELRLPAVHRLRLGWARVGEIVRALEASAGLTVGSLELAAVRGTDAVGGEGTLAFGEGTVRLRWVGTERGIDLRVMAEGAAPRRLRVTLRGGAGVLESQTSDERGEVAFRDVEAGNYEVVLEDGREAYAEVRLELKRDGDLGEVEGSM